jgi:pimeloyl-ACP methyl ester carboxylesterase
MAHAYRYVQSGDCRIRAAVEGSGPLVLMVHGWPESWYSWRHQMGPIAAAGYTAAAIDVRGYGGSDKPYPIEAYDMESIVKDIQAVADELGGGKAILIGHDWGAPIVWNSALIDPARFIAVAGMAIPYLGQGKAPFIDIARKLYTENGLFFYQIRIQDVGDVEAECEADVRSTLRKIYYGICADAAPGSWPLDKKHGDGLLHRLVDPEKFPAWLSDEDIDFYVKEFEGSGFRGPFNRYRNFHRDFPYLQQFADRKIEQPALFITGAQDMAIRMFGREVEPRMRELVPDLRGYHLIENCGHWTQQEKPAEVNKLLLEWLKTL